jgi:hypothetical protein
VPGLLIQCADVLPYGVADIPCPPRHREAVLARLPELADLLLIQDQEEVEVGAAVEPDGHPRVLVQWSSAQTRRDTEARRQFGNAMTAQTRHANALVPAHDPDLSDLDGPYPGMPWDGPGIPGLLF